MYMCVVQHTHNDVHNIVLYFICSCVHIDIVHIHTYTYVHVKTLEHTPSSVIYESPNEGGPCSHLQFIQ